MNRIVDELRDHLQTRLRVNVESLGDDDPLFSAGVLDSFSMVEVILFIEKQTGARMSPADVTLDNIDSISRIAGYVARCTGGQRKEAA